MVEPFGEAAMNAWRSRFCCIPDSSLIVSVVFWQGPLGIGLHDDERLNTITTGHDVTMT